jgi:hypothetical protein
LFAVGGVGKPGKILHTGAFAVRESESKDGELWVRISKTVFSVVVRSQAKSLELCKCSQSRLKNISLVDVVESLSGLDRWTGLPGTRQTSQGRL